MRRSVKSLTSPSLLCLVINNENNSDRKSASLTLCSDLIFVTNSLCWQGKKVKFVTGTQRSLPRGTRISLPTATPVERATRTWWQGENHISTNLGVFIILQMGE